MTLELLTWIIPLPPLLAFALIVLFTGRSRALSHTLAIVGAATSFVLSMIVVFSVLPEGGHHLGDHPIASAIAWLPTGDTALSMGVLVDPLTVVMMAFVPLATFLIIVYSVGYSNFGKPRDDHDHIGSPPHNGVEPLYSRFFALLSLFTGAMLILVVADNLLLMFVGWEIMGLCSYLLIGFWYGRNYEDPNQVTPRIAGIKAFITTRIGDVFMLLGIAYLYSVTGTLSFREILFEESVLEMLAEMPSLLAGFSAATVISVLLFIGTIGKSAQFPLHTWLPDAMEGPTPVSAMIHAAAMVSAGVYAVVRMYPLISAGGWHGGHVEPTQAMMVIGVVGAFTALFAATIAVAQYDVKKVLAYSTISQLGYMIAAIGIGAWVAAAFHLMTHAFFKALLFMGSGSIIHGMEHGMHHSHEDIDPQDMRYMGGLARKMPITFWTFVAGGFALSGFPIITAGFWSKDEILAEAWVNNQVVFWVLALAAILTAFYTMRQISMTFLGKPRTHAAEHAHESTWTMTLPLVILAVLAIFAGFVGVNPQFPVLGPILSPEFNNFEHWIIYALPEFMAKNIKPLPFEEFAIPLALSVFLIAPGGLLLGWLLYGRKPLATPDSPDPIAGPLGPIFTLLHNKYYFDELYDAVFVKPVIWASEHLVYNIIDRGIIDGILHAVGNAMKPIGNTFFNIFEEPIITGGADWLSHIIGTFGDSFRAIQTGKVQQYLLVSLFGALAFVGVFLYWIFLA